MPALQQPIYLDYNATTPVDPRVLDAMLPYFTQKFGNASSKTHAFGWVAEQAVDTARQQVAALIHAEPSEIIFTSGATEAINLSLKGVFEAYRTKGNHIITAATEHKAVLDCCKKLEQLGARITYIPVNSDGLVSISHLQQAITPQTILISVMLANNEIGVIQPVEDIALIAHARNILFMSDATQAVGKIKVDVNESHIDLMPFSAHKLYGPKGVGALFVRRKNPRVSLIAQMDGGGHERNLRSGTLNVPGIVGLGKACTIAANELASDMQRIAQLRDMLQAALQQHYPEARINGSQTVRLPNTLNIAFPGIDSAQLLKRLATTVAAASGSACTSAVPEPSYVLKALGLDDATAYSSLRFSLGKPTTSEEIRVAIREITALVKRAA